MIKNFYNYFIAMVADKFDDIYLTTRVKRFVFRLFQHQIHLTFIPSEFLYAVKMIGITAKNKIAHIEAITIDGVTATGGTMACSPPMVGCFIQTKKTEETACQQTVRCV